MEEKAKKNNAEEQLELTIKEVADAGKDKIKEYEVTVNTAQSGIVEINTPLINGELKAIIIECKVNVNVSISLSNYSEVIVFEDVDFKGQKYLRLAVEPILQFNERLQYVGEDWVLNDKLFISVKGPKNAQVKFVVRWE